MVRAILAGTKTQTRRVAKDVRHPDFGNLYAPAALAREPQHVIDRACPKGQPGDHLWVRETWNRFEPWGGFHYAADYEAFGIGPDDDPDHIPDHEVRWRPSIHMPRAACRIVLEIERIRIERLQAINEMDARAEGAEYHDGRGIGHSGWRHDLGDVHADARSAFARLCNDINGAGAWDANPWVWVVEFRPVAP
ncbi:hypothetical protein [Bordetella petrii]|uniref:hypothetical protein n=1 Tax=Bordetella petrii TaxID=94624 RepID=UPI0004B05CAB|nr:hypothetical protein [Bordetella petrii]